MSSSPLARIVMITAALALPLLAVAQGPPPAPKRLVPKLRIDETTHNWGKILQGESHRHTFRLMNDGGAPLRINSVKSSCGCTTVDWTKVIEPGSSGEVTLEINTTKLKSKHVKKYATIDCNDPAGPKQKIFIEGDLIQIIETDPKIVNLAGLAGTTLQGTVTVKPGTDLSIEVTGAMARSRHVEVLGIEPLDDGQSYQLTLQAMLSQRPAKLRDSLEITYRTGDGQTRTTAIQVAVDHRDRIQLQPRGNVVFQRRDTARLRSENAAPVVRSVIVSSGGPQVSFQVKDVQVTNVPEGLFDYEVVPLQEGKRYKVNLRCLRHHDERFVRGELVIITDDPETPARKVRIFAQFGNVRSKPPVRKPVSKPLQKPDGKPVPKPGGDS